MEDRQIIELSLAQDAVRRAEKRRPLRGAVAAVLTLTVAAGAVWGLLRSTRRPGELPSEPRLSTPVQTPRTEPATESFPFPTDPSQTDETQLRGDDFRSLEDYYRSLQEADWSTRYRDTRLDIRPDPALEAALLGLSFGGLRLGQSLEEVLALRGEPDGGVTQPIAYADGSRFCGCVYRFDDGGGLCLDFVDLGEGFVLNRIRTDANLEQMPLGLAIGQTFDEAEAALAAEPVLYAAGERREYDCRDGDVGFLEGYISAQLRDVETGAPGMLRLDLTYADRKEGGPHCVDTICLGDLWPEQPQESALDWQDETNARFTADEVAVWLPAAGGWQGQVWQAEEAKAICTQFSVTLPEPWDYDGSAPAALVDFRNGYAAALFDEGEHGAVCRVADQGAFEAGLAAGDPLRGLELLEYVQFAPNTLQTVRDPYAVAADWALPFTVGARFDRLLTAIREKDAALFTAAGMDLVLFREKGHYVVAGVFDGGERITAYGRFSAAHRLLDATLGFPMIDLEDPAMLLGRKLSDLEARYGAPVFGEERDGVRCPCYLTNTGYVLLLHPAGDRVGAVECYDQAPTPTTLTAPSVAAYQPGDTTPTWQPALAASWPADADCTPAQLLEKWLAVEGLTQADLDARGCGQLILTAAQPGDGAETLVCCCERSPEGTFVPVSGLSSLRGHLGKNGLMHDRRRDSLTSPAGLWALGYAFGNEQPPEGLKLPWRQVTPNSDWVCDEWSVYFNTWQERDDPTLTETWSDDVEHLEDYPTQYAWAVVVEFNLPPDAIPERGCAIFLHCGDGGTGGCVSLPAADLLAVLRWLDASKSPCILITGWQQESP